MTLRKPFTWKNTLNLRKISNKATYIKEYLFRIKNQKQCRLPNLDPSRRERSRKTVTWLPAQFQPTLYSPPLRIPQPPCRPLQEFPSMLTPIQTQPMALVQTGTDNLRPKIQETGFSVLSFCMTVFCDFSEVMLLFHSEIVLCDPNTKQISSVYSLGKQNKA